jgi:hypothetical protein
MPFEYGPCGEAHSILSGGKWWLLPSPGSVSLVRSRSPLAPPSTKVLQQGINKLVVWFCAGSCEWISCLSLFLVPSRSSSTPLYPRKCCEPRSVPPTLDSFAIFTLDSLLSLSRSLGVLQILFYLQFLTLTHAHPKNWMTHNITKNLLYFKWHMFINIWFVESPKSKYLIPCIPKFVWYYNVTSCYGCTWPNSWTFPIVRNLLLDEEAITFLGEGASPFWGWASTTSRTSPTFNSP